MPAATRFACDACVLRLLPRRPTSFLASLALLLACSTAHAVEFAPPVDLAPGIGFTTVVALGPEDPDPSSPADGCVYAVSGEKGEVRRICFDASKTVTSNAAVIDLNGPADAEFTLGLEFNLRKLEQDGPSPGLTAIIQSSSLGGRG